jgi:hypothetical protein
MHGKYTTGICLDARKVFDTVHSIFLQNLQNAAIIEMALTGFSWV